MPTKPCSLMTLMVTAFAVLAVPAGTVRAQDCLHWGDLDKALYCDENRDLLADTPSQGYQLEDPDTLVFSYVPVEDASMEKNAFADLMAHMSKKTGKKIRWMDAKSDAEQIKAMRSGEVHVAGVSPGPTVYAVNLAGYVPVAVMCRADGSFGGPLQLISRNDSGIASTSDLGGRKIAYASALSNSGGVAAAGSEIVYSGSPGASISGVLNGNYAATAVSSNFLARIQKAGGAAAKDLRVIWESQPYPSTSFGFAHNLAPDLQRKVHDAFISFDWKGSGLAREFGAQVEKFCTISYQDAWAPIRQLQKENGVIYDVKDL
jgi:phosphonate transport system substrate-binding protein